MTDRRFPIRRYWWLKPLLALFGGVRSGSYVEVGRERIRVRFGPLFDERFPFDAVESVRLAGWPLFFGLGWRTDLRGRIALVGSYAGIVEIRFRAKRRVRFLLPFLHLACDRILVSLEEPRDFLTAAESLLSAPDAEVDSTS